MNYCLIKEGEIVDGPRTLDRTFADAIKYSQLSDAELKELFWLPVEYPEALEIDHATQRRLPDTYEVLEDKVVVAFHVEDKSQEEIDADALAAAEQQSILSDAEKVSLMEGFLKAKFSEDVLFPEELK